MTPPEARTAPLRSEPASFEEDLNLVRRCAARDPGAIAELVQRYEPTLFHALVAALRRCNRDPAAFEIDDLLADLLADLLRDSCARLQRYAGRCSLAAWLKVVAGNHVIDHLRRQRPTVSLDADAAESDHLRRTLVGAQAPPDELASARQLLQALSAALDTLPEDDRTFVQLFFVEGMTFEQIAQVLRTSVDAVYARKSRLRQRLRAALGAGGTPP